MRLAEFISKNTERISKDWEKFAASRVPAATTMSLKERRDHIEEILRRITEDLAEPQSPAQEAEKAKGNLDGQTGVTTAAASHGTARAESGYTTEQMVSEFRALRACVVRRWLDEMDHCDRETFDDMTRFHEAIDQALAESVKSFTENVDHAKELFLGILGHDLRTPLGAVMMGATLMITEEGADWRHAKTASRILGSGTRMDEIIRDLLDFTRGRLGGGIPVSRHEMDLEPLLRESIDELSAHHVGRAIRLTSKTSVVGTWDRARLGQVMANLIGNACQHGAPGEPVDVTLSVERDMAVVAIHNTGAMIAAQQLQNIFEPFRRLGRGQPRNHASSSVGLGLYIAKSIVSAHQGTIDVSSSSDGTTFTVRLPLGAVDSSSGDPTIKVSVPGAA